MKRIMLEWSFSLQAIHFTRVLASVKSDCSGQTKMPDIISFEQIANACLPKVYQQDVCLRQRQRLRRRNGRSWMPECHMPEQRIPML